MAPAGHPGEDAALYDTVRAVAVELCPALFQGLDRVFQVLAGAAEVRDTFKVPKVGTIAGCHVVEGTIPRSAAVRLLRDNRVIYEGKIASLRRFKDDVSEVKQGFECGIALDRYQDVKVGDVIEAYQIEKIAGLMEA